MADEADRANDRAQLDLDRALAAARAKAPIQPTGQCLYCEEPVGDGLRYCDIYCARDHEDEQRIRARQGAR